MKGKQINKEAPALTPPIKWAGGKRWLAPKIKELYIESKSRALIEPFCGGAAVALHIRPKRAALNDINKHLMIFWNHIKDGGKLIDCGGNTREAFDLARERFNWYKFPIAQGNAEELASLFYYLNRTCFNGLFRVNKKGEFNVPFGQFKTISYQTGFPELAEAMKDWQLTCGNFLTGELNNCKSHFIYSDPPYDSEFSAFDAEGFNWTDQQILAEGLATFKGTVVASNRATSRIVKLYRKLGFKVHTIEAPRRISCNGDREKVKEILAIKRKV